MVTNNPYGPTIAKPTVNPSTGGAAMPATVSGATGSSVIAASQARANEQNAIVASGSGMKVKVSGGSKRSKRSKKHGGKRSKKHGGTRNRKRGGSHELGFSPFPSTGMLLSEAQYSQAGLSPEYKNAVEFDSVMLRSAM